MCNGHNSATCAFQLMGSGQIYATDAFRLMGSGTQTATIYKLLDFFTTTRFPSYAHFSCIYCVLTFGISLRGAYAL